MAKLHTVRQTAAGAIALPVAGLRLVRVRVGQAAGNTPADVAWLYDGTSVAHFPAVSGEAGSADGVTDFIMDQPVNALNIPAGVFTWTGTVTFVEWTFSDSANPGGATFADHRAILFRRVDAGAVTATISVNFDAGQSQPKAILAAMTPAATRARFQFPATGGLQEQVECVAPGAGPNRIGPDGTLRRMPAPDIPAAAALVLTGTSDAATTIAAWVYY